MHVNSLLITFNSGIFQCPKKWSGHGLTTLEWNETQLQWNAIIEQNVTTKASSKLQPKPKLPDRTVSPIASDGAKTWPRLKSISSEKPTIIKPKPQLNSRSASQPMIKPLLKPKPKNYDIVPKNNLLTGTKSKFEIRSTSQVNNAGAKPKPDIKPKPHRNASVSSNSQLAAKTKPNHFREKFHSISSPKSLFTENDTQPKLAHQYFNLTMTVLYVDQICT